jgi:2-polyprenyl-3-methyl-5-hydroxy-6-metoxy-1,4-benzoquinol methylase
MKKSSVQKLNKLNQTFYNQVAESFDDSREYFWPGWEKLHQPIQLVASHKNNQLLSVLDVGCGNGRFAQWLDSHSIQANYLGIDSNALLLQAAQQKNKKLAQVRTNFAQTDIIEKILNKENLAGLTSNPTKKFDLIVCFGVLHHIPGKENRMQLIQMCKDQLTNNGLLAVATWDFSTIPSLMDRSQKLSETTLIPDPEQNDYLLDWKRQNHQDQITPQRYCHLISLQETKNWWSGIGLNLMLHYTADGPQNASNRYFIASHHSR